MNKKIIIVMIVIILLYLIPLSLVVINRHQNLDNKVNYLIVLGAKVNKNQPSTALKERLDRAYDYHLKYPNTKIVVSGGQGKDEAYPEADVMKRYLVDKGISPQLIIIEDKSKTTQENLENTKKIIGSQDNIGLVTNDFHLYRASLLCDKTFNTKCHLQSANTHIQDSLLYYLREPLALYKALIYSLF